MTVTDEYEELEKELAKPRPALRVITGGKGTPEGPKTNWLQDFEQGQWFLYHDKTEPVDALVAMVKFKWKTSTIIYSHQFGNRIVRNVPFCERNVLLEVLDKEDLDGKGTEVRSSDVEDDENAAG